jgi:hypothetical protein
VSPSTEQSPSAAWRIIGAAVQGSAHERLDLPCQDALGYWITPSGAALITVADGAGSAEKAEQGAQTAVRVALGALEAGLTPGSPDDEAGWRNLIEESFFQARQALEEMAAAESLPIQSFATTLACAVALDGLLVTGQVGDGVVVAGTGQEDLFVASLPQRGEYANETFFLTLPDALERLEVQVFFQPIAALALLSDGLTRLALQLPAYQPHLPFFAPLLTFAARARDKTRAEEQLAEFLLSERVRARTDDDKTLVLAVRPDFQFEMEPGERTEPDEPG